MAGIRLCTPGADSKGVATRVLWTVSSYVVGKHAAWSEQEARALLFRPLDISEDRITFGDRVCNGVQFQRETVAAAKYLSTAWQVTPQELGIDQPEIQLVKTNCSLPGFGEYLRLNDNRLVVAIHGVFFYFDPAVER